MHKRHKRCGFDPWVRKIPWKRAWQPTPVFLTGESHGQRSLWGYSPWGSQRVGHDCSDWAQHNCVWVITCRVDPGPSLSAAGAHQHLHQKPRFWSTPGGVNRGGLEWMVDIWRFITAGRCYLPGVSLEMCGEIWGCYIDWKEKRMWTIKVQQWADRPTQ